MQKLDLSLDLPDAPYIRHAPLNLDFDFDLELDAGLGATPPATVGAAGPAAVSASSVPSPWIAPETEAPVARGPDALPLPGPLAADDLEVRHKVAEALRQFGRSEMSVVPADATVHGDLVCKSIRVQGELSGSVRASGLVWVEEGAVLNGQILEAEMVVLFGTVATAANRAAIRCKGWVVLAASARVIGHVQCALVAIYQGAHLVGTVQAVVD